MAAFTGAVKAHDTGAEHDAHAVLAVWCEAELVAHALAAEGAVHSGPGNGGEGRPLVAGMLAGHEAIVWLVERSRGSAGVDAVVAR